MEEDVDARHLGAGGISGAANSVVESIPVSGFRVLGGAARPDSEWPARLFAGLMSPSEPVPGWPLLRPLTRRPGTGGRASPVPPL